MMIKKGKGRRKKEKKREIERRLSSPKALVYHRNHATAAATPKLQPHMLPVNILR
jgi:hypothetical protein